MKKVIQRGFTLIELLVVISIIGVLTTLIVNNLNESRARARDSKRKTELTQVKTALQMYYNDKQTYPPTLAPEDHTFIDGPTTYMKVLPPEFTYTKVADSFILTVTLENASDPSLAASHAACPPDTYTATTYVVCSN